MPVNVTVPDDPDILARLAAVEQGLINQGEDLRVEESARMDADAGEGIARADADSAEATTRAAEDAKLLARIVALEAAQPAPAPTTVIGLWYAAQADYTTLKSRGFTAVHEWADTTGGRKAQIDAARAAGLDFCLDLSWAMEAGTFRQARLDNMLFHYKNYPGIRWVVTYDEPDLNNWPVAECQKMYNAVKAAWPTVLQKVVVRYPFRTTGAPYIPYCDILSVDPYIIPYGPAAQVEDETRQTVAVAGGKPVATDVQVFNWKNTFSPPGRYPTVSEVTTMATGAVKAQGGTSRMIWYWDSAGLKSTEGAAVYAAMGTINQQVRAAV